MLSQCKLSSSKKEVDNFVLSSNETKTNAEVPCKCGRTEKEIETITLTKEEFQQIQDRMVKLTESNHELKAKSRRMKKNFDSFMSEKSKKSTVYTTLVHENDELKKKLHQMTSSSLDDLSNVLGYQKDSYMATIKDLVGKKESLETQLDDLQTAIIKLDFQKLSNLQHANSAILSGISDSDFDSGGSVKASDECIAQDYYDEIVDGAKENKTDNSKKILQLSKNVKELHKQIAILRTTSASKIEKLKKIIQEKDSKIDKMSLNLSTHMHTISKQKKSESFQDEIAKRDRSIESLKETVKHMGKLLAENELILKQGKKFKQKLLSENSLLRLKTAK